MAEWTAEVYENEYLEPSATDVHAIVTVTCKGAGVAGESGAAAEMIIVDVSGSMSQPYSKIDSARRAAAEAVDEIVEGTWFAVLAGNDHAMMVFPREGGMVRCTDATRRDAQEAVRHLQPGGGTAIGSWLNAAVGVFGTEQAVQRHAILLTDGKNETETPAVLHDAVNRATGTFQCDCRGVGADWDVNELRGISSALLGSVGLIAEPEKMEEDFRQMMQAAMARGVADAQLRVWAPQGAEILFVRQVAPAIEDLTGARRHRERTRARLSDGLVGRRVARLPRCSPRPVEGARRGAARCARAARRR